jgi:hypothetical protein
MEFGVVAAKGRIDSGGYQRPYEFMICSFLVLLLLCVLVPFDLIVCSKCESCCSLSMVSDKFISTFTSCLSTRMLTSTIALLDISYASQRLPLPVLYRRWLTCSSTDSSKVKFPCWSKFRPSHCYFILRCMRLTANRGLDHSSSHKSLSVNTSHFALRFQLTLRTTSRHKT